MWCRRARARLLAAFSKGLAASTVLGDGELHHPAVCVPHRGFFSDIPFSLLFVVRTLSSCVAILSVQRESTLPFPPPGALLSDATFQRLAHEANPAVIDT